VFQQLCQFCTVSPRATDFFARRIFTDERDWPENGEPTYAGYSIGRWIDEDGDGRFDTLEVETRGPFKGPWITMRPACPSTSTISRFSRSACIATRPTQKILHDEITVIDHALTRPWTVDKKYVLNPNPRPVWEEVYQSLQKCRCHRGNDR
jgi:hypothetical protein